MKAVAVVAVALCLVLLKKKRTTQPNYAVAFCFQCQKTLKPYVFVLLYTKELCSSAFIKYNNI